MDASVQTKQMNCEKLMLIRMSLNSYKELLLEPNILYYHKYLGIVTIFSSMQWVGSKMYNELGVSSS